MGSVSAIVCHFDLLLVDFEDPLPELTSPVTISVNSPRVHEMFIYFCILRMNNNKAFCCLIFIKFILSRFLYHTNNPQRGIYS